DDRRLQCHHVRRRRHLVFFGLGTGARLRRLDGAWYSYLDRDGGDDDADDDRALVPLQAADEVADLTNFTKPCGSSRNGGEGIECSHETPAPRAREHQISVHAVSPGELSLLGAPLDR